MKRFEVFPGGASQECTNTRTLGNHIVLDSERFAVSLSRDENLRLMHKWFQAATPKTHFECSRLTLEGE